MIVAFTSPHSGGATFLDWSWHWLKGNKKFWNHEIGWIPLIDNPLGNINAHGHKKNHPGDIESWWRFLDLAQNQMLSPKTDVTFYPNLASVDGMMEQYVQNLNLMTEKNVAVVVIKKTMLAPYVSERTGRDSEHDVRMFLSHNPDIDPGLPIRKIREAASVRLVPQAKGWLREIDRAFRSLSNSVLVLNDDEVLDDIESCMEKIFSHHNLKISPERLDHWRTIANDWHRKARQEHDFYNSELPELCDAIVKGSPLELDESKTGFVRQSVIMAHLMKDHGSRLLLPTDEFPKNTKDLHRFLK